MKPKKAPLRQPDLSPIFSALFKHGVPWRPREEDPVPASLALALAIEILRLLHDRGLLTEVSLNDLLDDAAGQFEGGKADSLAERVRVSLKRRDDE